LARYIRKPKKHRLLKALACILTVLILGVVAYGAYFFVMLNSIERVPVPDNSSDLGIGQPGDYYPNEVTTIALFGIDDRGDGAGRSDAILLLTVDPGNHKVKVTSLMRDSYVNVDGYGMTKLGHAYIYGGAQLAIKTINQNFDLNITDYVTVNFNQLAEVIDALGGVEIDITEAERASANVNIREVAILNGDEGGADYIEAAGLQTLSGSQAVGYARIRNVGNSDFERTERQRLVLNKLFDKALKLGPTQYPAVLAKILPLVQTSLTNSEILSIGFNALKGGTPAFEQARFPLDEDIAPATGSTINGVWYLTYSDENTISKLHDFLFNDISPYEE